MGQKWEEAVCPFWDKFGREFPKGCFFPKGQNSVALWEIKLSLQELNLLREKWEKTVYLISIHKHENMDHFKQ